LLITIGPPRHLIYLLKQQFKGIQWIIRGRRDLQSLAGFAISAVEKLGLPLLRGLVFCSKRQARQLDYDRWCIWLPAKCSCQFGGVRPDKKIALKVFIASDKFKIQRHP
jgi:hypothetical protein